MQLWQVDTPTIYCAKWSPSRFVVLMEDLSSKVQFPSVWMEPPCRYGALLGRCTGH